MENTNEETNLKKHQSQKNNSQNLQSHNRKINKNNSSKYKASENKKNEGKSQSNQAGSEKVLSAVPAEFESTPASKVKINRPALEYKQKKTTSFESGSNNHLTWRSFLEEMRYEQALLSKDLKELSGSAKYVSKNILKKFTSLATTKLRQKAEYYPDSIRKLADALCRIEKEILKDIKDPRKEEQEEQVFGPK